MAPVEGVLIFNCSVMSYFPQEVFRQGFDFSRDTPLERHFSVRNATLSTMLGVLV